MRSTSLVLFLSVAVGIVLVVNRHRESAPPPVATTATSQVSEHDWAKHALDRAADVKRQVAQQREEDDVK